VQATLREQFHRLRLPARAATRTALVFAWLTARNRRRGAAGCGVVSNGHKTGSARSTCALRGKRGPVSGAACASQSSATSLKRASGWPARQVCSKAGGRLQLRVRASASSCRSKPCGGHRHQRVSTVPGPAQGTHCVAVRTASSRSLGMGPAQSSHQPVKPASSRSRARAARLSISSACRAAPLAAQPLLTASPRSELASRSTNAVRRACTQLGSTSASSAEGATSSGGLIESNVVPPICRRTRHPGRPLTDTRLSP
jgi:hypothetical protein